MDIMRIVYRFSGCLTIIHRDVTIMIGSDFGKLSSNRVYTLLSTVKGSALETNAILLAHGARDNQEKFVSNTLEQVKVEDTRDLKIAKSIQQARSWESKVVQHEQSHMQAGGEFAGAASFVYSKGADGRTYITGGEVSVKVPAGGDLERLKYALGRVKRAAMSPADPSPQDIMTAAMASTREASVNQEIIRKKALETYEKQKSEKTVEEPAAAEPLRNFKFREISSFEMAI